VLFLFNKIVKKSPVGISAFWQSQKTVELALGVKPQLKDFERIWPTN